MSYIHDDSDILNNISVDFDYGDLDITPNDHYINAAKHFISKMDEIIYLLLKKEQDGRGQVKTAVWALALALGSKHLEGKSMTEIAEHLGVTRAGVSKQAVQFCKALNLPASPYMSPAHKRYGKETELQKATRLVESARDKADGLCVIDITKKLIEHNIDKFKDVDSNPVECWGKIVRLGRHGKGKVISSVFIKNQYIEKMFQGAETKKDIVKAWIASGALVMSGKEGPIVNCSVIKKIQGSVYRGYLVSYKSR